MDFGSSLALNRLCPSLATASSAASSSSSSDSSSSSSSSSSLKSLRDVQRCNDEAANRALTVTCLFQTRLSFRNCARLTPAVFDRLAEVTHIRYLDLQGTSVRDVKPLSACRQLLELNLRYTSVADVSPLAGLPALRHLDLGSTLVTDVACLAECPKLRTLFIDCTAVSSLDDLLDRQPLSSIPPSALDVVNAGTTSVPLSLKPSRQRVVKTKSRSYQFFESVITDNVPKVEEALKGGQDVNERPCLPFNDSLFSPLYQTRCQQSTRFFKCGPSSSASLRPTALHVAAFLGNAAVVETLVRHGAALTAKAAFGKCLPAFNIAEGLEDCEITAENVAKLCGGDRENIYKRLYKLEGRMDWKDVVAEKTFNVLKAMIGEEAAEANRNVVTYEAF